MNRKQAIKNFLLFTFSIFALFFLTYFILFFRDNGGDIYNIHVTNITSNSFTVVWQTEAPTLSELIVSESNSFIDIFPRQSFNYRSFYDDSEVNQNVDGDWVLISSERKKRNIHHVTVRNLNPETKYYFRILGDFRSFGENQVVSTFRISDVIESPDPIYGLALNYTEPENFASEGVVIFQIKNNNLISQKISSLINPQNGGWQYDLAKIRDQEGNIVRFPKDTTSKIEIDIFTNIYEGSGFGDLSAYQPIRTIFYGVFYDVKENADKNVY